MGSFPWTRPQIFRTWDVNGRTQSVQGYSCRPWKKVGAFQIKTKCFPSWVSVRQSLENLQKSDFGGKGEKNTITSMSGAKLLKLVNIMSARQDFRSLWTSIHDWEFCGPCILDLSLAQFSFSVALWSWAFISLNLSIEQSNFWCVLACKCWGPFLCFSDVLLCLPTQT